MKKEMLIMPSGPFLTPTLIYSKAKMNREREEEYVESELWFILKILDN